MKLKQAIYDALDEIITLCNAHKPPLVARAGRWKLMRADYERAENSGDTAAVQIGKLLPFTLHSRQ